MKFKIDENLPIEVIAILKDNGFNAHSVHDENLSGAKDEEIYSKCQEENRIIITLDLDFSDIRNYPPSSSNGIIVFRLKDYTKRHVISIIEKSISFLKEDDIRGKLWIIEETRIRIRE